jgi:hypothetical protein
MLFTSSPSNHSQRNSNSTTATSETASSPEQDTTKHNSITVNDVNNVNGINISTTLSHVDCVVLFISNYFSYQIRKTKSMNVHHHHHCKSVLHSKLVPNLTMHQFITRVIKYTHIDINSLLSAFYYVLLLLKRNNNIYITINNAYNLLLVASVLSIKYNEDVKYTNEYYAKIGGIQIKKFNKFEYEFITLINFDLFIHHETFECFINELLTS